MSWLPAFIHTCAETFPVQVESKFGSMYIVLADAITLAWYSVDDVAMLVISKVEIEEVSIV